MPITVTTLLNLQLVYCILGVGYNVVSFIKLKTGGQQLSSTSPVSGATFMSVYGLCLIIGYAGFYGSYRVAMVICLIIFGYGGIIKHFIDYSRNPEGYSSKTAWLSAIGVNSFGFLLNLIATSGHFETVILT